MSVASVSQSVRPGEIVDAGQLEELRRWQLLGFGVEPDDAYVSDSPIVTICGCGRSGTMLTRVMLDSHPAKPKAETQRAEGRSFSREQGRLR